MGIPCVQMRQGGGRASERVVTANGGGGEVSGSKDEARLECLRKSIVNDTECGQKSKYIPN